MKFTALFLTSIMTVSAVAAPSAECTKAARRAQYQAQYAAEAEVMFKELYEDARSSNKIATRIFIPSALAFTFLGVGVLFGSAYGSTASTFAIAAGAPGLAVSNWVVNTFNISNATIPFVLGWASQAAPAVYAVGHGGYRFFHDDQTVELTAEELGKTMVELESLQKKLDLDRAAIYANSNHSQFVDGLLLGSLDRNMAAKLYNNAIAARQVADAKAKLLKLQCE